MKLLKRVSNFMLAAVMVTVLGCACSTSPKSDGVGGYWDDMLITTKVKSAFYDERSLKITDISVETVQGVVHLSGAVEKKGSIKTAIQTARKVEGVKAVKSSLKVKRAKKKESGG